MYESFGVQVAVDIDRFRGSCPEFVYHLSNVSRCW